MNDIWISIVVPIYNTKDYLRECVDSLVNQTVKDHIEVILVDDGSTDGSELICDEYAHKYDCVKTIHKKNGGQSSARNMGIRASTGEYLMYVDSDDYILPDTCEKLYHAGLQHKKPDIIWGGTS